MTGLRIALELELPIDAVTTTFGILAKKGAGKSNAAVVMAEEMWKCQVPWVAIDPKGDWWGMRSSRDGTKPGLPLVVFGGAHGDLVLEPTGGALMADIVLESRLTCILDVSEFNKAETTRFLLAFGERLYRKTPAGNEPMHLFLEEAHEYIPQVVRGDQANMVGAWQRLVKAGRFKGIGCTLVTQRSAALNKDVLTQVDTLIAMRTTSPQDRAAVKAWVDVHAEHDFMMQELPGLANGEAWVWSPELGSQTLTKIRFRQRETFDSGATPKVGEKRKPPGTFADVDLAVIKERMADTIERAQADDPKRLKARIKELERQVRERVPDSTPQVIREQFVPPQLIEDANDARQRGIVVRNLVETVVEALDELRRVVQSDMRGAVDEWAAKVDSIQARSVSGRPPALQAGDTGSIPVRAATPAPSVERLILDAGGAIVLNKAEKTILNVLASVHPGALTQIQLSILSGYSKKSSSLANALGALRRLGLATKGTPCAATQEGVDLLGDTVQPLPSGEDLLVHWLQMDLMGKADRTILHAVVRAWPEELTKAELETATGYSPTSSSTANALGKLRSLGLIERGTIRAADDFAQAVLG